MDLTNTIQAKSDQVNADDLISGPITVTIESVSAGSAEQPVDIHLVERPGKAYRPSKSMRRVMVACWGKEASAYAGHRLTLYRDPSIKFGGEAIGGIKISHLSHIDKRQSIALTVKRGQRQMHIVDPLPDAPKPQPAQHLPSREEVAACDDLATLQAWSAASTGQRKAAIEARIAELMTDDDTPSAEEYPMSGAEEQGELAQ